MRSLFQETHVGNTFYGKKNKQREFSEKRKGPLANNLPPLCVTRVSEKSNDDKLSPQNDSEGIIDIF